MECSDVFKLDTEDRACKCGKVTGRYTNHRSAITNGEGYSIAIGNGSLINAINACIITENKSPNADRQTFIDNAKISYAWVRPNEGKGNPNTTVED